MIAIAGAPALAEDPSVQVISLSSTDVASGDRTTLKYSVTNNNALGVPGATSVKINVTGMSCTGQCSPTATIQPGASEDFEATLTAPTVGAGQTRDVRVTITASVGSGNDVDRGQASESIKVRGPDKPQTVTNVSGTVKDTKGKAVSGAQVIMQDSADHRYETTSDGDGGYSFRSTDSKPIAVGTLSVGAGKDGYEPAAVNAVGVAGKSVNVPLKLTAKVTPSATPSSTEGASAPPVDETTDEATEPTPADTVNADNASNNSGGNSMLFIILGGLLVAAGIGAIVLVLMRRRNNNGDDDDDQDGGVPSGPMPPGRGGGGYGDQTRVAAPVGGRGNDATMVAGAGAASLSDAPTMLQRAVPADDEFPDPYGAPVRPVPQPTYGGAPNPYANPGPATQTYGAAVPAQAGGYDDGYYADDQQQQYYGGGQQEPQQRFDEPTGMYRPAEDEYAAPEQGYQAPAGAGTYGRGPQQPDPGYGPPAWDAPADNGNAYGAPASAGAYGGGAYGGGGGYDQAGGYDQGGYEQPGYDQPPPQRGGGYGGGQEYGAPPAGNSYGGPPQGGPARGGPPPAQGGVPRGGAPAHGGPTYGGQGGYEPGGYDQGGYDQGGYEQPGYDQRGGGYDQRGDQGGYYGAEQQGGGRHGGPPPRQQPPEEPAHPGQRRLPWMDD